MAQQAPSGYWHAAQMALCVGPMADMDRRCRISPACPLGQRKDACCIVLMGSKVAKVKSCHVHYHLVETPALKDFSISDSDSCLWRDENTAHLVVRDMVRSDFI